MEDYTVILSDPEIPSISDTMVFYDPEVPPSINLEEIDPISLAELISVCSSAVRKDNVVYFS
jgi:hypothetical protein